MYIKIRLFIALHLYGKIKLNRETYIIPQNDISIPERDHIQDNFSLSLNKYVIVFI